MGLRYGGKRLSESEWGWGDGDGPDDTSSKYISNVYH